MPLSSLLNQLRTPRKRMMKNNTVVRIVVSVLTIPLILLLIFLGGYWFLTFGLVIGILSFFEFAGMTEKKSAHPMKIAGLLSVLALIANSFFRFSGFLELLLIIVVVTLLIELFRNMGSAIDNLGATYLGIFYIGLCSASLIGIREFFPVYENGGFLIISIFATIWICDSAAFFGGISLGKHKLFPRVSPNKSWEGAIFGFVFSIATMVAARYLILGFLSWQDILIIGFIVGTIGQLGDLVESLFKRDAGVKDSSSLIPGHGGIFDRFDSLMLTAPVVYLYLKHFV